MIQQGLKLREDNYQIEYVVVVPYKEFEREPYNFHEYFENENYSES